MGKPQSKVIENGDAQVTVIQNQEIHSIEHGQQFIILWVILVAVLMQLAFTLHGAYKKLEKRNALKAARSIAALDTV